MGVKIVEPVPVSRRLWNNGVETLRHWYHAPGRKIFAAQLSRLRVAHSGIQLNYGWLSEPARPDEARIGGGVKLQHLRARFGESREAFNVLYLVSSVIHLVPHVEELVGWARRNAVPVVWNQNGVAYPAWCGERYPWFNAPMRRLIHQADHVVYQSQFCRDSADRYLGAVTASASVLFNPVDAGVFTPLAKPPSPHVWQLLTVGTSHAFYRVQTAIDCLRILLKRGISSRLTIVGELRWPGAEEEVRRYLGESGMSDQVVLRPRFSQAEAPAIYRAAHVLIHAKYKDPCPTVPIEAMACGVPVVGSRSGGMPELVPQSAGRLVDVPDDWTADHAPDPAALADAVAAVMARHAEFADAARRHAVATFDRTAWVDRHAEIFARLVER